MKRWITDRLTGNVTIPRWQWAAYAFVFWVSFAATVIGWIAALLARITH